MHISKYKSKFCLGIFLLHIFSLWTSTLPESCKFHKELNSSLPHPLGLGSTSLPNFPLSPSAFHCAVGGHPTHLQAKTLDYDTSALPLGSPPSTCCPQKSLSERVRIFLLPLLNSSCGCFPKFTPFPISLSPSSPPSP